MTKSSSDINASVRSSVVRVALLASILILALTIYSASYASPAHADPRGEPPAPEALPSYVAHGRPSTYAAVGDSYTSGYGLQPKVKSQPNSWPAIGCGQATVNFPRLVAADFGARYPGPTLEIKDASCRGVTTDQLLATDPITGNLPQLDAVNNVDNPVTPAVEKKTDLVTISLGINDINLIGLMNNCAAFLEDPPPPPSAPPANTNDPCNDFDSEYQTNRFFPSPEALDSLADEVAWNIADVRTKVPEARILVVGYQPIMPTISKEAADAQPVPTYLCPDVTLDNGTTENSLKIRSGDMAEYRKIEERLNGILKGQAERYGGIWPVDRGVRFVDILGDPYSAGHDVCKPQGTRWIEPRRGYVGLKSVLMHPNAAGHQNARRVIQHFIPKSIW